MACIHRVALARFPTFMELGALPMSALRWFTMTGHQREGLARTYSLSTYNILIGLRPCRRPLFPYVGMPYIIGRKPQKIFSVRFPRFSPSVHQFTPGTHLFFRFSMKLVGFPESQPKRLSETHFPKIPPSFLSSNIILEQCIFGKRDANLPNDFARNFWDPSRVVASALLCRHSFLGILVNCS